MKKLLLSVAVLSIMLMSCYRSSKGKWTEEDKNQAREELMTGFSHEDGMNLFSIELRNKYCDCVIDKIENHYDNFRQADNDENGLPDVISSCSSTLLEDLEGSLPQ